ncbi:MAG: protein kinase [Kofleriaceae bacterium]
MPGESAESRIGSVVDDRYKLLEVMAAGAMGEVYKGERVPVGKLVAVKFLHASMASDSEFQARFDRETRVMSKLNHPNCVSVVDFGVWKDNPYLVMDFVAGTTLRQRLDDDGALPIEKALAFGRQIAAGLAHAHEQGIIHRDIKPANIMISDEIGHGERIRILDFGLARLRGNVGRDATQHNMVVGTPNYMAPEQTVPGGTIDARTDLYALGVLLFEMIVGERPFAAEDTMALLGMHRGAPIPRLVDRVPEGTELPDGIQKLIDKAMAKSPADRFQSAIELADAIDVVAKPRVEAIVIEATHEASRPHKPGATAVGMASTMHDIDTTLPDPPRASMPNIPTGKSIWPRLIAVLILVGGIGGAAYYLITHRDNGPVADAPKPHDAAALVVNTPIDAAAVAEIQIDAAPQQVATVEIDAGEGSGSGSDEEIQIDPEKAEDLDPQKGSAETAEDEASDAPATNQEAETKPAPVKIALATNLHDAVVLIQQGHREEAIASLRTLRTKQPKSAYIPFLLGNLYFDKTWWSVSMDNYAQAIHINAAYKSNGVISKNLIKMLASSKTRGRASKFLLGMGRPAAPYVKYAAAHDPNPIIKKSAAGLAKQIR